MGSRFKRYFFLSFAVALVGLSAKVQAQDTAKSQEKAQPLACPKDVAKWKSWRDSVIDIYRDKGLNRGCMTVLDTLDACEETFKLVEAVSAVSDAPSFGKSKKCFGEPRAFSRSVCDPISGVAMDPTAYRKQAEAVNPQAVNIPFSLSGNGRFLEMITRRLEQTSTDPKAQAKLLREIEALVVKANPSAKLIAYRSAHFSSPGMRRTDKGRLLIYFPGKFTDQWIQIGLPQESYKDGLKFDQNVSMVSVVKNDANGNALKPPQSFFSDFDVKTLQRPTRQGLVRQNKIMDCGGCHFNGPNPVWGDSIKAPVLNAGSTLALNKIAASYGRVRQPGFPSDSDEPTLEVGSVANRDPAKIWGCDQAMMTKIGPKGAAKVAQSMNCASCHNSKGVGTLHISGVGIMTTAIMRGFMPPGSNLTQDERAALLSCLRGEVEARLLLKNDPGSPRGVETIHTKRLRAFACDVSAKTQVSLPAQATSSWQNAQPVVVPSEAKTTPGTAGQAKP